VKVTEVPEQTGFADAEMLTLTGRFGFTVMVTGAEVAGFPVAQVALDVKTQVITSPLTGILLYVLLLAPTLTPFNFH
jgi:hypothetical protein